MTSNTGLLRHWKKRMDTNTAVTRCWLLTYAECCHAHFSVTRTSGTATTAHRHSHSEIASKNAKWMHSQCGTKATALMLVCWNCFKKPLNNELKTAAPPKQRPTLSGVNCCARCSMWFKMKHGKTTCDVNRTKDTWKSMILKCLRGLGRLWSQCCPRYSFGHGSSTRRRVCRPHRLGDWVL